MAFTALLALLAIIGEQPGSGDERDPEIDPALRCRELCRDLPCTSFEFFGFSPDGAQVGYSRLRCPGAHSRNGQARLKWHLSVLKSGSPKVLLAGIRQTGVSFPRYFRRNGFVITEVGGAEQEKNSWTFSAADGTSFTVELRTEETMACYFSVASPSGRSYRHRWQLSEIYFGIRPRLFLSPDGRRAALLLALDAGVKVDGELAVFSAAP